MYMFNNASVFNSDRNINKSVDDIWLAVSSTWMVDSLYRNIMEIELQDRIGNNKRIEYIALGRDRRYFKIVGYDLYHRKGRKLNEYVLLKKGWKE